MSNEMSCMFYYYVFKTKLMTEPNEAFNVLRVFLEVFGLVKHAKISYFVIPYIS
jgi:hypothetical protein